MTKYITKNIYEHKKTLVNVELVPRMFHILEFLIRMFDQKAIQKVRFLERF